MDDQLNGAVVVVAGASSGLGLATAMEAAPPGAEVVLVARDRERLDAARVWVGGERPSLRPRRRRRRRGGGPVRRPRPRSTTSPCSPASSRTPGGRHDSRAVPARPRRPGLGGPQPVRERGPADAGRARVVHVLVGRVGWRPRPDRAAGAAATAALESFARAMAVELAPIRVNSICPGAFDTPVLQRAFGDRKDEAAAGRTCRPAPARPARPAGGARPRRALPDAQRPTSPVPCCTSTVAPLLI